MTLFSKSPRVEVRLNLSREDYEIIEAIAYSGQFSYRFPADFYRDAIRAQIDRFACEHHLGDLVTRYNRSQETRYRSVFELLADQIILLVAVNRISEAQVHLQQTITHVNNEPRGFWRDWFLEKAHKQLGALIAGQDCRTALFANGVRMRRMPNAAAND